MRIVTDTIRKIDFEMARYSKLLGTLLSRIDATGLHVAEADLVAVLQRSLCITLEVNRTKHLEPLH